MWSRSLLCLFALCQALVSVGQSLALNGVVSVQSSTIRSGSRQFVEGAAIRSPGARPVISDALGRFALSFVGLPGGTTVELSVAKPGMLVVNQHELDAAVIGRLTDFHVVMVDSVTNHRTRQRYEARYRERIERTYGQQRARILNDTRSLAERLDSLNLVLTSSVSSLGEFLEELTAERDAALNRSIEIADRLARVDLDSTSQRFRSALAAFETGTPEDVLQVLGDEALSKEYRMASDQRSSGAVLIEKAGVAIRGVVQCMELKADVLQGALRSKEALSVRREVLVILERDEDVFSAGELTDALIRIGTLEFDMGAFPAALIDLQRALARCEDPQDGSARRRTILRRLAAVHSGMADYDRAKTCVEEALSSALSLFGPVHFEVMESEQLLSQIHQRTGDQHKALDHARRAMTTARSLYGGDVREMQPLYADLVSSFYVLAEYDSVAHYASLDLAVSERNEAGHTRDRASGHEGLALAYEGLDRNTEAMEQVKRALDIKVRYDGPGHPYALRTRASLAVMFLNLGAPDSALHHLGICAAGMREIHSDDHPELANVIMNTAIAYGELGAKDLAIECFREAEVKLSSKLGDTHPDLSTLHFNLGQLLKDQGQLDSAYAHLEKSNTILTLAFGPEHPRIAATSATIADIRLRQGDVPGAVSGYQRARTIWMRSPDIQQARWMGLVMDWSIGHAHVLNADPDSSVRYLLLARSAIGETTRMGPPRDGMLYRIHKDLAESMLHLQRSDAARSYCDSARSLAGELEVDDLRLLAARISLLEGDSADAEALLESIDTLDDAGSRPDANTLGKALLLRAEICLDRGQYGIADTFLKRSCRILPSVGAFWASYRSAMAQQDYHGALAHAIECARICAAQPQTPIGRVRDVRQAIRELAIKLERQDLIDEFSTE